MIICNHCGKAGGHWVPTPTPPEHLTPSLSRLNDDFWLWWPTAGWGNSRTRRIVAKHLARIAADPNFSRKEFFTALAEVNGAPIPWLARYKPRPHLHLVSSR
jgi:hypothetical protein